jgi:hypothetical protein
MGSTYQNIIIPIRRYQFTKSIVILENEELKTTGNYYLPYMEDNFTANK